MLPICSSICGSCRPAIRCEPLADLVFFYLGEALDWDVELALKASEVVPMKLGSFGQLGWTSWVAPNWASNDEWRCDARFHPAEQMRHKRETQARFVERASGLAWIATRRMSNGCDQSALRERTPRFDHAGKGRPR